VRFSPLKPLYSAILQEAQYSLFSEWQLSGAEFALANINFRDKPDTQSVKITDTTRLYAYARRTQLTATTSMMIVIIGLSKGPGLALMHSGR
jgi:hypothetical protein